MEKILFFQKKKKSFCGTSQALESEQVGICTRSSAIKSAFLDLLCAIPERDNPSLSLGLEITL